MNHLFYGKKLRSVFAVIMTAALIVSAVPTAFAAGSSDVIGQYNYVITNPYGNVNWDTWKPYRGATHVHTVRSDGNVEVDDMIEDYYAHGYQTLALTDHGTVNYSWHKKQTRVAIFDYQFFVHGALDILSDERYEQITTGSDRGGDPMTEIPLGIELNGASTAKCHVNSYFADCGHGDLEMTAKWPEDAVKKCQKAGGVCHINHVGEWTDGKDDIGTYDASFVKDFADLFLNYSSCIGMELVNTRDSRTHNDRYLYDETLKKTAPTGKNVFGFCEDDSHDPEDVANNAQFFMMPQNTWQNVRVSMETGAFFACSKTSKNPWELGDGFQAQGDFPMISRIEVNEEKDQITFYPVRGNVIKMVGEGNVIDEKGIIADNTAVTFDLNSYENSIGSYVRFYVTGPGGICYIQPFLLKRSSLDKSLLKFNVTPSDSQIIVKNSAGQTIEAANENNEYLITEGSYECVFSHDGYETAIKSFTIGSSPIRQTVDVSLEKILLFSSDDNTAEVDYKRQFVFTSAGIKKSELNQVLVPGENCSVSYMATPSGFGTGTVITVNDSAGNKIDYELVIIGDVTGDGIYDGRDAVAADAIRCGMPYGTQAHKLAADWNKSGNVDQKDISIISDKGVYKDIIV